MGYPVQAWRLRRALTRVKNRLCRHLYRDAAPETGRTMIVAGTGRSGTTWLADLVGSQVSVREIFEPFYPRQVPEYRDFHYFQYARPGEDHPELELFCRSLFRGEIRNAWIDRRVSRLRPRWRLVKTIRGTLLLGWIRRTFPEVPAVFIVRHPCAVVASRMRLAWATDGDIDPFLAQPALAEDFLAPHMDVIREAATAEEKHAVVWSVSNLVPLLQLGPDQLQVISYERLWSAPREELPRMFAALRQPYRDDVFQRLGRISETARPESAVARGEDATTAWRSSLAAEQVERIQGVVRAFGLDVLYDAAGRSRPEGHAELRRARRGTV